MKQREAIFAQCRQAIDVTCAILGLRPAFSLAALLAALEDVRRRHIFLVETTTMPHSHTAMAIWMPHHDMICYRAGFESAHRRLTICHELSHIIGNHPRLELPAHLFDAHPEFRAIAEHGHVYICGRTVYDDPVELEAEYMGTYLASLLTPTDDEIVGSILQL
jgi:antirestriction protein ArdC